MKTLAATILAAALAAAPVLADTTSGTPATPVTQKDVRVAGVKKRSPHHHRHAHKKGASKANAETKTETNK